METNARNSFYTDPFNIVESLCFGLKDRFLPTQVVLECYGTHILKSVPHTTTTDGGIIPPSRKMGRRSRPRSPPSAEHGRSPVLHHKTAKQKNNLVSLQCLPRSRVWCLVTGYMLLWPWPQVQFRCCSRLKHKIKWKVMVPDRIEAFGWDAGLTETFTLQLVEPLLCSWNKQTCYPNLQSMQVLHI